MEQILNIFIQADPRHNISNSNELRDQLKNIEWME